MKSILITQYPLTNELHNKFNEITGRELEQVVVSTLTTSGYLGLLKFFLSKKADHLYIPVVDSSGAPLLPLLQIIALLVRAKRRHIIDKGFVVKRLSAIKIINDALRLTIASVNSFAAMLGEWWRLSRILKLSRIPIPSEWDQQVTYLKTNLWLGVQAGGSIAHTSGVIKGLLNQGCRVDYASVQEPIGLPPDENLNIALIKPRMTYVVPRELNHFRHNTPFIEQAADLVRSNEGIIYQRLSLANYAGVVLSRQYSRPLVVEYNGSEVWLAKNWGTPLSFAKLAHMAEEVCLKHAHLIVAISSVLKDELIARGVEEHRIVVTPNGVDTTDFDSSRFSSAEKKALRSHYDISNGAKVVTFVGTFGPWHGAEVFAEAVTELYQKHEEFFSEGKVHFMFLGDGSRRSDVETILRDKKYQQCLSIPGLINQKDAPLHLAISDVLVAPHVRNKDGSRFIGSPTKLFEYLSAGKSVVASDIEQMSQVLCQSPMMSEVDGGLAFPDGATGIRVQPEDAEELARAIKFLIDNDDWMEASGINARKLACEKYTWDHHVQQILSKLNENRVKENSLPRRNIVLLFNCLHSKTGGGLNYLRAMLPLLANAPDIKLHLCVHENQQLEEIEKLEDKITVHRVNSDEGFPGLHIYEQFRLSKLEREIGADVTFSPANYGPLSSRNSIIMLRNSLSVGLLERRPMKILYWLALYAATVISIVRAKRVIVVSSYALYAASGGLTKIIRNRVSIIYHGVSDIFKPPLSGKEREKFVLTVSDIYVQKNLKNLILALNDVVKERPDTKLLVVGRPIDVVYFQEVEHLISKLNLENHVEFLGGLPQSDLVKLYQTCGVFAFPSLIETFGNPLVEAMRCGAPIVTSCTAAMPEVVKDAALLFEPDKPEQIANSIVDVLSNPDLANDLSRKSIQRGADFSWTKSANKAISVIREAADSSL